MAERVAWNGHVEVSYAKPLPRFELERWRVWIDPMDETDYCQPFHTIYKVGLFGWGLGFSIPAWLGNGLQRLLFGPCHRCGGANYGATGHKDLNDEIER